MVDKFYKKIENENDILKAYTFGVPIKNHGFDGQFKRKVQFFQEKFGHDKKSTQRVKSNSRNSKNTTPMSRKKKLDISELQ